MPGGHLLLVVAVGLSGPWSGGQARRLHGGGDVVVPLRLESLDDGAVVRPLGQWMAKRHLGPAGDLFLPSAHVVGAQDPAPYWIDLGHQQMPMVIMASLSGAGFDVLDHYRSLGVETKFFGQHPHQFPCLGAGCWGFRAKGVVPNGVSCAVLGRVDHHGV